jgi:GDP-L-fucose synthase
VSSGGGDRRLDQDRVLVTGGAGFLGRVVVRKLRERGCRNTFVARSRDYDLVRGSDIRRLLADVRPHVVLHLAARVGGIGANRDNPATFFYDNAMMGIQLMEQARLAGAEKFVTVGTVCAYPKFAPVPFREDDLWNGYPEETNAPYGLAKRMLLVQGQAYREQYGFDAIYLLPANLYGPADNFDPATSHVIPALIRRFVEAKERTAGHVVNWGDGTPTREFLYVDDAADGVLLAAERYDSAEPVNLGTGQEISMAALSCKIAGLVGYAGEVRWDPRLPNGQPRRALDTRRAEISFGFRASVDLDEGLRRTIEWYLSNRSAIASSLETARSVD